MKGVVSMTIQKIQLSNFTVFEQLDIEFCEGINLFIGDNGTGKTHLMKLIYSACKAADPRISFSQKIVNTFRPDDFKIGRLVHKRHGTTSSSVKIYAKKEELLKTLSINFSTRTTKWDAEVKNEENWEKTLSNIESTFIPAKEILSNSYNIISANEKNNVDFDDTYIDIIHSAKVDISVGRNAQGKKKQLERLEKIIEGKVFFDVPKDKFYLKYGQSKVEFNLVAEGIRKIALLWQLMKNGTLEKGSILFWDEPEANINPVHIPLLVDMLLELQNGGVQIFISTHDYTLCKYFDIKARTEGTVKFHSLYKTERGVKCESNEKFKNLERNTIRDTFIQLYKDEVKMEMES